MTVLSRLASAPSVGWLPAPRRLLLPAFALALTALARALDGVVADATREGLVCLLALPLFVELPRQVALAGGSARLHRAAGIDPLTFESQALHWLAGTLLIVTAGAALSPLPLFHPALFVALLLVFVVCSPYTGDAPAWQLFRAFAPRWTFLLVPLLALAPLLVIRTHQPYPMLDGFGIASYAYRMQQFLQDGIIRLAPGLHTPVHSAVFGPFAWLFETHPLGPMWAAPVALYLVFSFGMWRLARLVLQDDVLALLAAGVAPFLLSVPTFQHMHAAGMGAFVFAIQPLIIAFALQTYETTAPRTRDVVRAVAFAAVLSAALMVVRYAAPYQVQPALVALLAAVALAVLARVRWEPRALFAGLAISAAGLTFLHAFAGPAAMALIGGLLLVRHLIETPRYRRIIVPSFVVAAVALFLVQQAGIITFSDPSAISRVLLGAGRANAITLDYSAKADLLRDSMSLSVILVLAVAAERRLFGRWTSITVAEGPTALTRDAIVAIVAASLFVYFLPESNSFRFVGFTIPLIAILLVSEIAYWAQVVTNWIRPAPRGHVAAMLLCAAILAAMAPSLSAPLRNQVPPSPRSLSAYDGEDLRVAAWLADNTTAETIIVSDPLTMFMLEGLACRPQIAETRRWIAISEYSAEDRARLWLLHPAVFHLDLEPNQVLTGICRLTSDRTFERIALVVHERTAGWAEAGLLPFLTGPPRDVEPFIARLTSDGTFAVAHRTSRSVILVPSERQGGGCTAAQASISPRLPQ